MSQTFKEVHDVFVRYFDSIVVVSLFVQLSEYLAFGCSTDMATGKKFLHRYNCGTLFRKGSQVNRLSLQICAVVCFRGFSP